MLVYRSIGVKIVRALGMVMCIIALALLAGCGEKNSTPSKMGDGMSDKDMKNMK